MNIAKEYIKAPRLYVEPDLSEGAAISLAEMHAHYLRNVLRKQEGDPLRLFNGRDGEWTATITGLAKKAVAVTIEEQLAAQKNPARRIHLYFAPIKKARLDMLIEKAIELGATDLHPVITQNTENRKLKEERIQTQIIEAAEQCERLDIPPLHAAVDFKTLLQNWDKPEKLMAALERIDAAPLSKTETDAHILIGPEGGFTAEEQDALADHDHVKPVTLGTHILRAETAVFKALSLLGG